MTLKSWWMSLARKSQKARPATRRGSLQLTLEALEDRLTPSTVKWINRGQASDNFDAAFGASANVARQVVDTAIRQWEGAIQNFNQVGHGDNNHIDVTISMNLDI